MNAHIFNIAGENLSALPSGALWWPRQKTMTVSDLHFGKSERILRRGGPILPPYDTRETLTRLEMDIEQTGATTVICLGDSFDDLAAAQGMGKDEKLWLTRLQAGRKWIWIEGNHDPGPVNLGGSHLAEYSRSTLTFRHIAEPAATGEISGHFHPKMTVRTRGRSITRPCFIYDQNRVLMPAYGAYTGGLNVTHQQIQSLFNPGAIAVLTGKTPYAMPLPVLS